VSRVLGDAGQHVGQPSLGIDIVHFCRDDDAVHGGGSLSAAIGAGEQPRLSAKGDATQRSFRGIVRQADTPLVEEAGECGLAFEHVLHRFGDVVAA
jgi:hypothetical protein